MPSGREIADTLAAALSGSVRELPTQGRADWIVVLDDGRVPLLVRHFAAHTLGVCLVGTRGWHDRPANFDAVQEIVEATRAWARAQPRELATMFECVAVLAEFLSARTGDAWTVSTPGTVVPSEIWLHPSVHSSGSVGVFADAVRVWNGNVSVEKVLVTRAELRPTSAGLQAIAAAVDQQAATHARNRDLEVQIETMTEQLVARLESRLGTCTLGRTGHVSHWGTIRTSLWFSGSSEVRVFAKDDRIIVEAGLVGAQGWSSREEAVDEMIDPIVAALELARRTLTIEALAKGQEYRVIEDLQELRTGMIVRFDRFDDIDNHYGRYEFTTREGVVVAVSGDFSTPRNSPLGETHRYLEVIA